MPHASNTVHTYESSASDGVFRSEEPEPLWRTWARPLSVIAIVVVLVGLGIANVVMRARWHQVEDGVLWSARAEGVTAVAIAADSPAAASGLRPGDILLAVNGVPVESPSDVVEFQHRGTAGMRLAYTLLRLDSREALQVSLVEAARPASMYFVLAGVGLFTLIVGASVRLRRPRDQATLHFFWLCVAFFGAFTFSFNGPFDRLDWTFYWGDAVSMALLPPLLLHFTLVFPERPRRRGRLSRPYLLLCAMYAPALVLGASRITAIARSSNGELLSRTLEVLDRFEPIYLFVCAISAVIVLTRGFGEKW